MKFLLLLILIIQNTCGELFTSLSDLETLLNTEGEIIHMMSKYVNAEENRLIKLRQVLNDLKSKHTGAVAEGSSYVTNPINSYLLVKRLSTDWNSIKDIIIDDENKEPILNISYHREDLTFPDVEDLHGAAMALIRLQQTYKLEASKIAVGQIEGARPTQVLTANDCFELGRQSYVNKDYKHTLEWMNQALLKLYSENLPSVSRVDVLEYAAFSHYMLGRVTEALELTRNLLQIDPDHPRATGNIIHYEKIIEKHKLKKIGDDGDIGNDEEEQYSVPDKSTYQSLCRGDKHITPLQESQMKCRYFHCNDPYCILVRAKEEELFLDPRIVRYHDVISDYEISIVQALATPKLKRATVQHHNGDLVTATYRISKSAWLQGNDHQVIDRINRRVAMLSGLTVATAEELQVANYGLGGHYEPHYDFARKEEKHAFKSLGVGNRIATMLFYMSDLEAGGSTVFTSLGIGVKPIKGSAVFWFNLFKSGEGDLRTRHAACPVLAGNKWVSNKWLHEYGQEFLRPCGLSPKD